MSPELRSWEQPCSPHLTVTAAAVQIGQIEPEGTVSNKLTEAILMSPNWTLARPQVSNNILLINITNVCTKHFPWKRLSICCCHCVSIVNKKDTTEVFFSFIFGACVGNKIFFYLRVTA